MNSLFFVNGQVYLTTDYFFSLLASRLIRTIAVSENKIRSKVHSFYFFNFLLVFFLFVFVCFFAILAVVINNNIFSR